MGVMVFLRNRAGIVIVLAIGLAIAAFLLSDAVRVGGPLFASNRNELAEVAGVTLAYGTYKEKLDQNESNFKQQMGQSELSPQLLEIIQESTWNQLVSEILLKKETECIGLVVSKNELNDMLTGSNPDPQIVQYFGDPKTGQLDRTQFNAFLANLQSQGANSKMHQQWGAFLMELKHRRLLNKYLNLIKNSLYVTSLEARDNHDGLNKLINFNYVQLGYASLPDHEVKLEETDYQKYYEEHKKEFYNLEENRLLEYVSFKADPSKADSDEAKSNVQKIAHDFQLTNNDSLFISIHSDISTPVAYVSQGKLDKNLDAAIFDAKPGRMVGPFFYNGFYELAKVLDKRVGPDSVTVSHILINPASEGGLSRAKAKADSIALVIRKGADFSRMAKQYSADASKDHGGFLGTFGRGMVASNFEEAIFNAKVGDIQVVNTTYGVHVIKIVAQKGAAKVAKVALVYKALISSQKTMQAAYSKASSFLNGVHNAKSFDEKTNKEQLTKIPITVREPQSFIEGLGNARALIKWAYKANEGDVSDQILEVGNNYLVAKVVAIRPKGQLNLTQIKTEITPLVFKEKKADLLLKKVNSALPAIHSLEEAAKQLHEPVKHVEHLVFANPIIPGLGEEEAVTGTAFGLKLGKLSSPIKGKQGVFFLKPLQVINDGMQNNMYFQQKGMLQALKQNTQSTVFKVLQEQAKIKDYRSSFF